jgi:hypothetical protein
LPSSAALSTRWLPTKRCIRTSWLAVPRRSGWPSATRTSAARFSSRETTQGDEAEAGLSKIDVALQDRRRNVRDYRATWMRSHAHVRRFRRTIVTHAALVNVPREPGRERRQHRGQPTLPAQRTQWHSRLRNRPPILADQRGFPLFSHPDHVSCGRHPPSSY